MTDADSHEEPAKELAAEFFCDVCGCYPIEPVHGHFACSACKNITKCCEGIALEV